MSSQAISSQGGDGHQPAWSSFTGGDKVETTSGADTTNTTDGEQELEQLRRENAELIGKLEARSKENALLNEVISTIDSTLKLDEVLRHLVNIVVRAISCHAAYIYLYDKEKE